MTEETNKIPRTQRNPWFYCPNCANYPDLISKHYMDGRMELEWDEREEEYYTVEEEVSNCDLITCGYCGEEVTDMRTKDEIDDE